MRLVSPRSARVLHWDIENRPSSYWYDGRTTAEITAIAWAWADDPKKVSCTLLDRRKDRIDLEAFVEAYDQADVVSGHYILGHDLGITNGALIEWGLPPLKPKLVSDTKNHLINFSELPKTQEHLCEMLGVPAPKVQMSQAKWREANRLTQKGVDLTWVRCVGDVKQHIQLRQVLLERGLLGKPRLWQP